MSQISKNSLKLVVIPEATSNPTSLRFRRQLKRHQLLWSRRLGRSNLHSVSLCESRQADPLFESCRCEEDWKRATRDQVQQAVEASQREHALEMRELRAHLQADQVRTRVAA